VCSRIDGRGGFVSSKIQSRNGGKNGVFEAGQRSAVGLIAFWWLRIALPGSRVAADDADGRDLRRSEANFGFDAFVANWAGWKIAMDGWGGC
jgi:hypothetical protein